MLNYDYAYIKSFASGYFFKKRFIYLLEKVTERRKEKDLPSSISLSKCPGDRLSQIKPRTQNSIQVFCIGGRKTSMWAIICPLPNSVIQSLDQKLQSQNTNQHQDADILSTSLTHCATFPTQISWYFNSVYHYICIAWGIQDPVRESKLYHHFFFNLRN